MYDTDKNLGPANADKCDLIGECKRQLFDVATYRKLSAEKVTSKKRPTSQVFFFLTDLRPVLPLGHFLHNKAWPGWVYYTILYDTRGAQSLHSEAWPDCVYRCCPLVITCTARHGQIVVTGATPRSSLAQQGMAWQIVSSLAQQGMARINENVGAGPRSLLARRGMAGSVQHNFAMFRLSFGFVVSLHYARLWSLPWQRAQPAIHGTWNESWTIDRCTCVVKVLLTHFVMKHHQYEARTNVLL